MSGLQRRMPVLGRWRGQRGMTLIELLIGMVIMGILSTMLLVTWFSLNKSYIFSVRSYEAHDNARLAVARMEREIRDAQSPAQSNSAMLRAHSSWVEFYTTFNEAGNSDPILAPHLVVYRMYKDGALWRFEDGHNGLAGIQGISTTSGFDPASLTAAQTQSEQANGEGASLILKNMTNATAKTVAVPLFRYSSVDSDGTVRFDSDVTSVNSVRAILGVQIHVLVDLNPGKAPVYVDFMTLAQLRNQRPL